IGLPAAAEPAHTARAAEAVFAAALSPGSRVFLEPLIDLDRTMDASYGLIDRLCNPRSAFHTVRCLNTILFSAPEPRHAAGIQALSPQPNHTIAPNAPSLHDPPNPATAARARRLTLEGASGAYHLLLPAMGEAISVNADRPTGADDRASTVECFCLKDGTSDTRALTGGRVSVTLSTKRGPALLRWPASPLPSRGRGPGG
ncbi:MAG: hypothetical protein ACRDI2_11755, partial [Chloroflexota bacterium]